MSILKNLPIKSAAELDAIPITEMTKPAAVVLDDEGNAIDQATGRQIQISQRMPTLKVNIREKKKEQLKFDVEVVAPQEEERKHFDPRMGYDVFPHFKSKRNSLLFWHEVFVIF